jgi:mono/diheme cytochrome c family protein
VMAAAALFLAALDRAEYFQQKAQPILKQHCIRCHNHELDDGGISFENRDSLIAYRPEHGPAIVPGEPEKSALARAIRHNGEIQMPPGKKLDQRDIDTLIEWIRMGAPFGKGAAGAKGRK